MLNNIWKIIKTTALGFVVLGVFLLLVVTKIIIVIAVLIVALLIGLMTKTFYEGLK